MRENLSDSGLLNIYKPSGLTSFQVVEVIRRILGIKKVGHCGTLDPLAEGILLVCFGKATKFSQIFVNQKKYYRGKMILGIATDTGDKAGKIILQKEAFPKTDSEIEKIFSLFVGEIEQTPPRYAALKYRGRKYYQYARAGEDFPRPKRKIKIYEFKLLENSFPEIGFSLSCSAGTYVRSLVEDVAAALGTCATLGSLVRERIGKFSIDDSLRWPNFQSLSREELFRRAVPLSEIENESILSPAPAH